MKTITTILGLAALLGGCASVGPKSIEVNRPAYNVAVQQTNDQELLLNLVRILYRDTLYFTSVERIAASMEFDQGYNSGAGIGQSRTSGGSHTLTRSLSLGASMAVNDKPTVFYAPVEGEKFVRQMMTPMNPDVLLMLVNSGWSLDRVFRVGVQEMNGLRNAPTAAGPTPSRAPEFHDFLEAVHLLRALQREQLLELGTAADGKGIELRFVRNAMQRPETARLRVLLGLAPGRDHFRIVTGAEAPNGDSIALTTRPLISALSYVAQGVVAPEADVKAGKVRRTVWADQKPFNWQDLLDGLFQVSSSDAPPQDASVSVFYRGHYFYIADNDLETKSTFVLLTQLMALHSAPATAGPAMSFSFGG